MPSNRKKKNHGDGLTHDHNHNAANSKPVQGKGNPKPRSPQKATRKTPPKTRRIHDNRPHRERFGKGDTMVSAQRMVDMQRQHADHLSRTQYCSAPPTGQNLVQVRLVIPGDHLVPKALSDLTVLDDIRREHEVWITREAGSSSFFDISSLRKQSLHTALEAFNQKIHDMRLSEESLAAQYFVQPPNSDAELAIIFEVGKRPAIKDAEQTRKESRYVLKELVAQLAAALPSSAKTLVALPCLKMRIHFGLVNITAKRKTVESLLSLEEFKSALDSYASRGRGVSIETEYGSRAMSLRGTADSYRFANFEAADKFVSSIMSNEDIVQKSTKDKMMADVDMALYHHVQFDLDKETVSVELMNEEGVTRASSVRRTEMGSSPPLDWIISAPDMKIDWSLQVTTHTNIIGGRSDPLSDTITKIVQSFAFKVDQTITETASDGLSKELKARQYFKLPKWQKPTRGDLTLASSNFKINSCARFRYRETPYEIEVSITQHWASVPTSTQPERLSWSVSVYGIHWEEALGEIKSGESSSGFEERILHRLWPGQGSFEERLSEFLECVLSVQTAIAEGQA